MRNQKVARQIVMGLGVALVASAVLAQRAPGRKAVPEKIDLAILPTGMRIARAGAAGADHQVRIDVTIAASCALTRCSGPFKVRVDSTDDPTTGRWTLVGEAGVADLCVRPAGATVSVERSFTDTVPAGAFRKYRATADPINQVSERNEGNNVGSAGYVAR